MQLKSGRFGKYFGCTNPECKNTRKLLRNGQAAGPKIDPVSLPELRCSKVDDFFLLRDGAAGIFPRGEPVPQASRDPRPLGHRAPAASLRDSREVPLSPRRSRAGSGGQARGDPLQPQGRGALRAVRGRGQAPRAGEPSTRTAPGRRRPSRRAMTKPPAAARRSRRPWRKKPPRRSRLPRRRPRRSRSSRRSPPRGNRRRRPPPRSRGKSSRSHLRLPRSRGFIRRRPGYPAVRQGAACESPIASCAAKRGISVSRGRHFRDFYPLDKHQKWLFVPCRRPKLLTIASHSSRGKLPIIILLNPFPESVQQCPNSPTESSARCGLFASSRGRDTAR